MTAEADSSIDERMPRNQHGHSTASRTEACNRLQTEFARADSDEIGGQQDLHLSFPNPAHHFHSTYDRVLTMLPELQHEWTRPPVGHLHHIQQALYHTSYVVILCGDHRDDRVHLEFPFCKMK